MSDDVIDDLTAPYPMTPRGTVWALSSDQVMGGVSDGAMTREEVSGRIALRLQGGVRLDNNGGFLQMSVDLEPGGAVLDASGWDGIAVTVRGNEEPYNVHLRTDAITRPWQSYRATFQATDAWETRVLLWADFEPHRLEATFDPAALRRIGLVAIGRAFQADLAVSDLRFIRR